MVLICTTATLCAQTPAQLFETFPGDVSRHYKFALNKGEAMHLEVMHIDDLQRLPGVDSLVAMVIADLSQMTDTSADVLHGRRIDYIVGGNEKQVRLRSTPDMSEYFTSNNGHTMLMKVAEDTVMITGGISVREPGTEDTFREPRTEATFREPRTETTPRTGAQAQNRYYRISFFLNDLRNLSNYKNGQLQQKIELLIKQANEKWLRAKDGRFYLKSVPGITASAPAGKLGGMGLLLFRPSVDIQNYKDRFVPSISFGLAIINRRNSIYQEYGLSNELHFRFASTNGTSKTFVQSFFTLSYGRGKITSNMSFPVKLFPYISVGYLAKQTGSLYEKNTFRLGLGRFFLGNVSTKIEPALYMNDLFKNITPSLRVVQIF